MDTTYETAPFPAAAGVVYRAGRTVAPAVCPRCPTFLASSSLVLRLDRPEPPDTLDGRHDRKTGRPYYATERPVDMKPRWWVHARCAHEGEVRS